MNSYIIITFRTFTIWILASIINGLLCGAYTSVTNQNSGGSAEVMVIFFVSLLLSIPGVFIFWIILIIKCANKIYERALFRAALSTGFILAAATAIICSELLEREFSRGKYVFILFALISSIASIMMHFTSFKKITK